MTVQGQQQETACMVGGRPLHDGDLVEVRGVRIGGIDGREMWIPMIAFDGGRRLELEDSTDYVPGSRTAPPVTASLAELIANGAQVRRR